MSRFTAALLLLCCLPAAAQKKPVTVEAIASEKPPSAPGVPEWSPDGKRFVYTESGKLRLYDVGTKASRELVSLDALERTAVKGEAPAEFAFENRGVKEKQVQWLPSGAALLVSAGGDLFLFHIEGGATQLTATPEPERDPKVSPDGLFVAFRRAHDLYSMEISSRKVTRLTRDGSETLRNGELDWVYPEELDLGTAYWWSPDSKSIAYLQFDVSREPVYPQVDLTRPDVTLEPERYPKAGEANADVLLGVVPAAGGRTQWMNAGETRSALLARFFWLPDSSGIAVERLNRIQNRLDLMIADAKTGATRPVLTESDPYWINVRDDLRFLKGGKEFLWSSERDGFNHIYRYSADGRLLGQMTRGDWEVSDVACVDEGAGLVYYLSTEASPLERQFYSVRLDGSGKRRISTEAGTHEISMAPDCGAYHDTFSNLTTPMRRSIHGSDGAELAVFTEPDRRPLEQYEVLPPEIVEVKAADGAILYGRLIKPAGFDARKKYPLIVNVYGGPHAQLVTNKWSGALTVEQALAQRGFLVWSLDGRGSFGRGHKWESAIFRNLGAKELEDQKEGVRRLVSLGFADPAKVGIYGWSYGGFMTLNALLRAPEVFACGMAGAPVTDLRHYDTIYTERYMGLPSENADAYDRISLLKAAGNLKGKLLIVHNLEDDNVLFQNTVRMAEALQQAGKLFDLMVYTNKSHGLVKGRDHFNKLLVSFLETHLR